MSKKFYVTTSIAYTNAPPHVGFALELVQADVLARYHGLSGDIRYFLTGTDEHGRKNAQAAEAADKTSKEWVDSISEHFKELAKMLDVSNDDFVRTSDQKKHWPGVFAFWEKLQESDDLYKDVYRGLYCIGCEAFKKPSDLVEGKCPEHQREPEKLEEENWFFRLSKYQDELKRLIDSDEIKIVPEERKNEILSFINQGLEDISFSRPSKDLPWGIPVPGDDTQTIYVWADALVNYISALGYGTDDEEKFKQFWPADVHVVGKDILRFHAIIWPAMLLSTKLSLPKTILVHGHVLSRGQKMSKSVGNVVDPFEYIEKYGADALRFFLLHEISTTGDGDFTKERFAAIYEADLSNTLGNLVSRVTKMGEGLKIIPSSTPEIDKEIKRRWDDSEAELNGFRLDSALDSVFALARFANEYIEKTRPWADKKVHDEELPHLAWILVHIAWMLAPFMPTTAREIFDQLGVDPGARDSWQDTVIVMKKGEPLFPRK